MGIFGFLSKAHIDSTMDAGVNTIEVKTLVQQEKITKERLDYLLARAKDPSTASNKLDKQIQDTQKELTEINKRKLPLLKESNKLTAEVGPIKYVGDMIYGVEDETGLDKAVRLVIMLIMVVFDPLAVLLLIAANMSMTKRSGRPIVEDGEITGLTPSDIPVFTDTVKSAEEFFEKVKEKSKKLDRDRVEIAKENITSIEDTVAPKEEQIIIDEASGESIPPLTVHVAPGVYEEHHPEPVKKLEPKYDYDEEFAFKEKKEKKQKLDGGDF